MEPPSPPSSGLSPGDVIAGKFRLERVIGRGGMGAVWAGRHLQLDMPVALKFIEPASVTPGAAGDGADARIRFEREARAAGQIRSPHVVHILDHGIDGDRPYIAMELLEGEDLGQRLRRERRIGLLAASRIVTQAAKALRRAHEAGIIHRDLKPGNIFLARFDDDEVVKLLDFGVAKMRRAGAIDEPLATQVGVVFGSPSYLSPEQARGARAIDHRSDLWSLAVILFRSITGVKPFEAASIADLVVKLCIDPLPVPSRVAPELPPAIDRFFERAFARDPDLRFSSAPELAAAFEAAIAAPPPLPVLAIAEPVADRLLAEPTPSTGTSAFPSGGWRQAPEPSKPHAARSRSRSPRVLAAMAASLGGAALAALGILLVARQGPPRAGAPGAAPQASATSRTPPASSLPEGLPKGPPEGPPEDQAAPSPSASSPSPEEPPSAPLEPLDDAARSAAPAPKASAGPHGPQRPGKKRRPNFGY